MRERVRLVSPDYNSFASAFAYCWHARLFYDSCDLYFASNVHPYDTRVSIHCFEEPFIASVGYYSPCMHLCWPARVIDRRWARVDLTAATVPVGDTFVRTIWTHSVLYVGDDT